MGLPLNVLPSGQVQYYVRDPTGNLIDVNCEDASTLPADILERANYLGNRFDQTEDQRKAELFLEQTKPVSLKGERMARRRGTGRRVGELDAVDPAKLIHASSDR